MGVKLRVSSARVIYNLELERKYTVIQGNSGTGKTLLTEFVELASRKDTAVSIECSLDVVVYPGGFDSIEYLRIFLSSRTGVVILDENTLTDCNVSAQDITEVLSKAEVYYILISREAQLFNQLPVSVHDMFWMKNSGKYNFLQRTYAKDIENDDVIEVDCIITEDSRSGAKFMEEYFPDIKVYKAKGKDNLIKEMIEHSKERMLLFYDALSAGFLESEIQRVTKRCRGGVYLYRPLCFEKYLLDSPFLCDVKYDDNKPIELLEEFYENILSQELPHGYSKRALPVCIKRDCATELKTGYGFCNKCKLQNLKSSKRELVIYGALSKVVRRK